MGATGDDSTVTTATSLGRPDAGRRHFLTGGVALAGLALAGALAPGVARADDTPDQGRGLVGAWQVYVPQPDGSTAVTVQVFHDDGTTVFQNNSGVVQGATIGAGLWGQRGDGTYAQTVLAPLYDPKTGTHTGRIKIQATLTLHKMGAEWTATGRISIYGPDGQLRTQVDASARATRIDLEPL